MESGTLMGGFYKICEWIMRLAYVNLLWILFSILGLIFLGVMPATAAMFAVVRKWVYGEPDIPVFRTFWNSYRTDFLKTNFFGLILTAMVYILYINYQFIALIEGWPAIVMNIGLITVSLLYINVIVFIFPVFAHFQLKTFQYIKFAFIIGISSPLQTIMIVVSIFGLSYIMLSFPGILPFFSGSIISLIVMWIASSAFRKIEERKSEETKLEEQSEKNGNLV